MTASAATADWLINPAATSVKHKTGLSISYENRPRQQAPALNIAGIEKLAGTAWEKKSNLLIEQGILILSRRKH